MTEPTAIPINLFENDRELIVVTPMPGVAAEDISVDVTRRRRPHPAGPPARRGAGAHQLPRCASGATARTSGPCSCPVRSTPARANLTYGNGVLTVSCPRPTPPRRPCGRGPDRPCSRRAPAAMRRRGPGPKTGGLRLRRVIRDHLFPAAWGRRPGLGANDEQRPLSAEGRGALAAAAAPGRRLRVAPDVVHQLAAAARSADRGSAVAGSACAVETVVDDRLRPGAGWGDMAHRHGADHGRGGSPWWATSPTCRRSLAELERRRLDRPAQGRHGLRGVLRRAGPGAGDLAWLCDPDLYATTR